MWDAANAMLEGNLEHLMHVRKKTVRSSTKNPRFYLRKLEKEQIKSKVSRRNKN